MDPRKHLFKPLEGIVVLALRVLAPDHEVTWNPTSYAVELVPDIVVGPSYMPQMVVLVTHRGPQNGGQVKAWRDLHELFLYRTQFPAARVVRVVFGPPGSQRWETHLEALYDHTLNTHTLPQAPQALALLMERTRSLYCELQREEVLTALETELKCPPIAALFAGLKSALNAAFNLRGAPQERLPLPPRGQIAEPFFPTALRRAVVFGSLFPEVLRDPKTLGSRTSRRLTESGLLLRTLTTHRWTTPYALWVKSTLSLLGPCALGRLIGRGRPLLALTRRRWRGLPTYLKRVLTAARRIDRGAPLHTLLAERRPEGVPLLLGVRYVQKVYGADSFGHGALLKAAGHRADTAALYRLSKVFRGELPVSPDLLEALTPHIVRAARTIRGISPSELAPKLFHTLFYDEAMKLRHVEPLLWLLQQHGPKGATLVSRCPTVVDPSARVGTLRVLQRDHSLVHWKTAHRGHRDKTKELAAKGYALFLQHPSLSNRTLFLDGDFTARDLTTLSLAGWTHLYPLSSVRLASNQEGLLWT